MGNTLCCESQDSCGNRCSHVEAVAVTAQPECEAEHHSYGSAAKSASVYVPEVPGQQPVATYVPAPQLQAREQKSPPPQQVSAGAEDTDGYVHGAPVDTVKDRSVEDVDVKSLTVTVTTDAGDTPSTTATQVVQAEPLVPVPSVPSAAPAALPSGQGSFRSAIGDFRGFSAQKQIEELEGFIAAIKADGEYPEPPDELVALRFLRARKLDIPKALQMYKAACKWRREERVDEALAEVVAPETQKLLEAVYPGHIVGRDLTGRPCKIMDLGKLDMRTAGVSEADFLRHHIRQMELLNKSVQWRDGSTEPTDEYTTAACPLEGIVLVIDIGSATFPKFWAGMNIWKAMGKIDQDCYPEIMGLSMLVNLPTGFDYGWKLSQAFIDPYTVSKIEVVSGDPAIRLKELVAQDVLPEMYREGSPRRTKGRTSSGSSWSFSR